jgi:hypothetical protein
VRTIGACACALVGATRYHDVAKIRPYLHGKSGFSRSSSFNNFYNIHFCILSIIEELDGAAVSALSVRSRKLSNVLKGQS